MRMSTVHSSSLTEHLLPWLMDLEQGIQIVEVCDSTLLQTDPIMGFPIPMSVLRRQMDVESILYLTSGKGVTECLQGRSISRGCVMPGVLLGWPDTRSNFLVHLHFTSLHFTSLHFTSLHFTSLHFTSLHFTLFSLKRICILQLMITSKIYGMVSTKCK